MTEENLFVIACCYRLSPEEMFKRIKKLLKSRNVSGYIVSSRVQSERKLNESWVVLPSDNDDFDFSAYITGAEKAQRENSIITTFIFLNDTLFTNHSAVANFNALWRQLGLMHVLEVPALAGRTDPYVTVCLQCPWSGVSRYVTTFCFALNRSALSVLFGLRAMAAADGVASDCPVDSPDWGINLPTNFRQYLKAILVYPESTNRWYRLNETNYSAKQISSKARCLYFEHRLSGAVANNGCLVPTNAGPRWEMYIRLSEYISRGWKVAKDSLKKPTNPSNARRG